MENIIKKQKVSILMHQMKYRQNLTVTIKIMEKKNKQLYQ